MTEVPVKAFKAFLPTMKALAIKCMANERERIALAKAQGRTRSALAEIAEAKRGTWNNEPRSKIIAR